LAGQPIKGASSLPMEKKAETATPSLTARRGVAESSRFGPG
jgi:hypothetical protein